MVDLRYSRDAAAVVTGGLRTFYTSPLDLSIIEEEFCRVLLELGRDCNQPWLQRHRIIVDDEVAFMVPIKTPTGVQGDLAIFWWPIDVDGDLFPYVGAIVPGYID